jgi:hypothetical protein
MSATSNDASAVTNDLPKAPAAIDGLFKRLAMHALTHGRTEADLHAMLVTVGKAHAAKIKADTAPAKPAKPAKPAAPAKPEAEIVSAILG